MDKFTCKDCIHAGEPHLFGDNLVVECRCAPVTINGFPIVDADCAGCTPGHKETVLTTIANNEDNPKPAEDETNMQDYIMRNNGDGTITSLHIPTTIMLLHDQVTTLVKEAEYNKRWSLWHLIKRW